MAEQEQYQSSIAYSTTTTTNCSLLCERLLKLRWRRQYLENATIAEGTLKFGGFTKAKVGPPGDLTKDEIEQWHAALENTWRWCVKEILIPSMERKEGAVEVSLARKLNQIDSQHSYTQFIESINRGIKHAKQKYDRKYRVKEISREVSNCIDKSSRENKRTNIGTDSSKYRTEQEYDRKCGVNREVLNNIDKFSEDNMGTKIGKDSFIFIRRGEKYTLEQNGFIKNSWIREKDNVFILLAHAIYNRTKLHNLLVRKMWEYIDRYEEIEKQKFRPFQGFLTNGQSKCINSWKQFKIALKNRSLRTTRYELDIIARLYCVQIRIMHDKTIYNDPYIVREKYQCIWKTERTSERAVNLLELQKGKWALLEGMEFNSNMGEIFENKVENIGKNTQCLAILKEDEERIDAVYENDKKGRVETEYDTTGEMNSKPLNEDRYSFLESGTYSEERINKVYTQPEIQNKLSIETIFNNEKEETESINTTESIKALFYEEGYYEIGSNREEEIDINTSTVDQRELRFSAISNVTTNTLPSIDSLENSYLHLNKKISVMKVSEKQKQASKTALKNALWQRCRVLERNRRRNENKKREFKDIREGKKMKNSNLVFDFTSIGLEDDEIEILSKGESFSLANDKIDEDRLKTDLYNYTRKLRILDELEERKNAIPIGLSQFSKITTTQASNQTRRSNSLTPGKENRSVTPIRDTVRITRSSTTTQVSHPTRRSNSQASSKGRISDTAIADTVRRSNSFSNRGDVKTDRNSRPSIKERIQQNSDNHIEEYRVDEGEQGHRQKVSSKKQRSLPSIYDPHSENRNLIRYNNCIQEEGFLVTKNKIPFRDNIEPKLRKAVKKLRDKVINREIIITKADKGSGLVILDYDLYIQKGTKYIEIESLAYRKTVVNQKDILAQIIKERNKIITKLKKENIIHERTATYCTHQIEEKITGMKFYYKVHKDTCIETMPLRPLQSCISSPTHHLSQVLTDILQPLLTVENIPTFIQDSNQLLFRLSKLPILDSNTTIITSDVAALYPSIPHREGLEAMESFLQTASYYNATQIRCIIQALELVITKNYVKWNGIVYEQTKGVAMGTPVAVAYANIFMHWVDTEIGRKAPYIVEHMRYIDDNLFIIPDQRVSDLMTIANSILNPSIKYTYEELDKEGEEGLPFLDTRLFISEEYKIESRLYTKKTDKHAYLLPSSYHPAHITQNIPLSTFYRIRRICSREEWFKADAMMAIEWLEDRDYKYKDITRAIGKAIEKDRWSLIEDIEKNRGMKKQRSEKEDQTNVVPIIVTYNQKAAQLKTVLNRRQDILDASFSNKTVRPRISYRRQSNIGDLLVQKSLRGPIGGLEQIERKFMECGVQQKYRSQCPCRGDHDRQKCRCCIHAWFEPKDIKIKLHKEVNCDSKNIIYLISCSICKKKYVGETQQKLRDRFMQHLNNIQKLKQPLYTHFKTVHKAEEVRVSVLETVRSIEPFMRKIREAWWINHLQTLEPKGFNVKLDCNQVYLEDRHNRIDKEKNPREIRENNRRDSNRTSLG